ncbi:MAG: OmpA family protein [Rhodospirillales bacterium]|nr:OmpA family protein [Rhodospirillales bacterium]
MKRLKTQLILLSGVMIAGGALLMGGALQAAEETPSTRSIIDQLKPSDGAFGFRGVRIVPPKKVMQNPEGSAVKPAKVTQEPPKPAPSPDPVKTTEPPKADPAPQPVKQAKAEPPSVNFKVTFEFNSVRLTEDAKRVLDNLGAALVSEELKVFRFLVAGHTDAKGSRDYNMALSKKRAASVRRYLVDTFRMAPARLQTTGYGEDRLLDPNKPNNAANRRVQITNLGPYQ